MADYFTSELTLSKSGFLFDHSSGLTYSLNPTGVFIFQKLQEEVAPEKLLGMITGEFGVDTDTARKDLDDFFRQLRELGIVNE